jgi:antitoxin component YwqK of YwqJK toxin-antitoxin module
METKIKRTYWGDGQLQSEQPCVGGMRHGMMKRWHPNGQLRSEQLYVDGKPHGVERWWWENGQLSSEVPYVDGVRHGMVKWWRQNGDIDEFRLYNQGEVVARFYPRNQTQRWKLK